ncbi:protein phosphatase 2C domain-containing protein [Paenibacillus sp. HN-1]|uniref:protein phosphatase 2C domain-containing protein n=1 Tax=Paenibacillus TaxID=44249 RepID=UPI001CAA3543|nr:MULTISPECIES: protein phosphatase 2C domain-containing protein [Paenibacillus]MBY9079772.1 protein phosphatase 2C domain-containing protein [Paenibacillus sp. CGMCC 1.18879]MBY9084416.1 protein phosphatase 2C domain-containing protein [Paenibacillus sinensis]
MEVQTISVQGTGVWNEDALIVHKAAHLYGVADGATSLVPFRGPEGETGGRMASQLLKRYFEEIDPADERSLEYLIREGNRLLGEVMTASGIQMDEKDQLWTSGAAIVRIREHYIEYVQAGDCMIMAAYADGSIRAITRDHVAHIDQEAKRIWRQAIRRGIKSKDELWELVKPQIVQNKAKMNTDHGYSVLNGRPEAEHYIEYGKINRIQLTGLLLHTDGLYYPEEESGDVVRNTGELLIRQIADTGLERYAEWLIEAENGDPECIRYPRFKKSDDKSGILMCRMNE